MTEEEKKNFVAHERIKMNLRINGTSLAKLAKLHGVSKTTMSWVGLRKLKNRHLERVIADAMREPVEKVFPNETQ